MSGTEAPREDEMLETTPTLDYSGLEVLSYEDCRALLSIAQVGLTGAQKPSTRRL